MSGAGILRPELTKIKGKIITFTQSDKQSLIKSGYNDVNTVHEIETRHQCNPYTFGCDKVMLPLFAAPMDTVVSMDNYTTFLYNKIIPCIPRALSTDRKNFGELKKHKASIFLSFGMSNDDFDIMEEYINGINVGRRLGSWLYDHSFNIHKMYRGMSTKGAQRSMGKSILKTSEGITKKQLVKYRLS